MTLAPAPSFPCPECGTKSAPAASFCGWCRRPLVGEADPLPLSLDDEGRPLVEPMDAVLDCPDPWAWASDGRSLYLFEGVDRGDKLAVRRVPTQVEARGPPVPLLAAGRVRGLAVSRRGAFAVARSSLHALLAARTADGADRPAEISLPGVEIVGCAGAGDRLLLAGLEGDRLTLRGGSTGAVPPILAACPWPERAPNWLRIYVEADSQTVLLWGAGLIGRADLDMGVLTLNAHADAPAAEALELLKRRGDPVDAQPLRPAGYPGVAPVPLRGGGWGLLDFASGTVAKPPADCARPLAVAAAGPGAAALFSDFIAYLEPVDGALHERRTPFAPAAAAGLSAGPEGALALISRPDGSLVLAAVHLASGRPPSARAEAELRREGFGAVAFPMAPPQAADGRLWVAAPASDRLLLWASPPAPAST